MSNSIYAILTKALPHLPADIAEEAQQAITDYNDETLLSARLGLTKTEAAIYTCLSASPGKAVPYAEVMKAASIHTIDSLWVHKRRLTQKLEGYGMTIVRKVSKAGGGYVLEKLEDEA